MNKLKVLIIFYLLINCQSFTKKDNISKSNSIRFKTKSINIEVKLCYDKSILDLVIEKDSIKGQHCFVFGDGTRIDCSEEDIKTIFMKKVNQSYWTGVMKSQYSENNIEISLKKASSESYKLILKKYDLASDIDFEICE